MDMTPRRRGLARPAIGRAVIVLPSAFTLGNLFFGIWAIVAAYNRNFTTAAWYVLFAGVLDMLDGRVARLSKTGTRFGAELDSLVDAISFGVAPAMIMYFLEFSTAGRFAWVICYAYVVAAVLRLARYNVLADTKPTGSGWFTGLPSTAAGMTLATWYPFSQTDFYRVTIEHMNLPRPGLAVLMIVASVLMVSNVKYPKFPAAGFRSARGLFGTAFSLTILGAGLTWPEYFFFPLGVTFIAFGLVRAAAMVLLDRPEVITSGTGDDEDDLNEGADERPETDL
jgi:CDP-diacylglycerol--serine O-phosphatidyltransferase